MTKVTADVYKEFQALENKKSDALDKGDELSLTQIDAQITQWALLNKVDLTQTVEVEGDVPDTGYVKPGGWGASTDASTWKVANMKDTPNLFKVTDSKGKNVAVNFRTQVGAQTYIDTHKGSPPPPPPPVGDGKIVNKGGRVIANGRVQFIFCGDWTSASPTIADIDGKFKALFTDGTYFSKLTQYGVQKPTYLGHVQSTVALPNPFGDADIVKVIGDAITTGKVPDFKPNGDMVYVVMPPKGTKNKDKVGDAYHTSFAFGGSDRGVLATFYGNYDIDSITIALSEEIIEGLTNAGPGADAWVDASGQEIGDVCDKPSTVAGVKVEQYWSNADKACVDGSGGGAPPPQPPGPGTGGVDQFGQKMIHPSKPGGQVITTHAARYFTRNYASGKPSEPTVEMDITGINFANQECTAIVQMTGMSHPDTIDWKLRGGQHSSSTPKTGTCYDVEVMTDGSASKTLEVESPHPDNHPAHQPQLFKPGDLSNARFGWKGVTLDTPDGKGVLIESWINMTPDDQNGWKKYISVVDTGQLYKPTSPILKPYGTIAKIRIDGIKGKPTFEAVSAREITN